MSAPRTDDRLAGQSDPAAFRNVHTTNTRPDCAPFAFRNVHTTDTPEADVPQGPHHGLLGGDAFVAMHRRASIRGGGTSCGRSERARTRPRPESVQPCSQDGHLGTRRRAGPAPSAPGRAEAGGRRRPSTPPRVRVQVRPAASDRRSPGRRRPGLLPSAPSAPRPGSGTRRSGCQPAPCRLRSRTAGRTRRGRSRASPACGRPGPCHRRSRARSRSRAGRR